MTKILSSLTFFPRFLSALAFTSLAVFFALALVLSFSPLAIAANHEDKDGNKVIEGDTVAGDLTQAEEPKDKVERKLERAKRLKKKGKIKKSTKVTTKAIITEYKAQKKYQRALELKKRGKFKKYNKKLRRSARLGSEEAQALIASFEDTADNEEETDAKKEAYLLVGEIEESSPYSDKAMQGDKRALYRIGSLYRDGTEKIEQNLSVAFAMFLHAEKRGSGRASNALSLLLPELTTDEVDVGRDVYKEWRALMQEASSSEGDNKEPANSEKPAGS